MSEGGILVYHTNKSTWACTQTWSCADRSSDSHSLALETHDDSS